MSNSTVISRFLASVAKYPDRPAVVLESESISYRDLAQASASMAEHLSLHNTAHAPICIWGSKRTHTYAGILAILRADCPYVPLNPKFPYQRNENILRLSGADLVMGEKEDDSFSDFLAQSAAKIDQVYEVAQTGMLLVKWKTQVRPVTTDSKDLAYILFTSGTTGQPKGVAIRHSQLDAYVSNIQRVIDLRPSDRCSHTFDLTFDLSVHDLFVTWSAGACLFIPRENDLLSPAQYIKRHGLSCFFCVPSVGEIMRKLRQLKVGQFPLLRQVLFCGEALSWPLVNEFIATAPQVRVTNLYGPTEATIAISSYTVDVTETLPSGIVPLGTIFPGNRGRINDFNSELLLSGRQVITEYYTEGQESRFIQEPDRVWYCTGDMVRQDETGCLYYIGRLDEQVKYKGYRIELQEIERCGELYRPDWRYAAVALTSSEKQVKSLVLFVETDADEERLGVQNFLREILPAYMCPEVIRFVKSFPLNANGKVDKKALAALVV